MMRRALVGGLAALLLSSVAAVGHGHATEDSGTSLQRLAELKRACRAAQHGEGGRPQLWAVVVSGGQWRFGPHSRREGLLKVDLRRNLRVFDGAAEVFPAGLEPMGLAADSERARELRELQARGAHLRIGFFLGFDEPHRTSCVIRPDVGVTTVRMDVAYVELLADDGRVLACETTDRLRAWLDDRERDRIPGSGPRGAIAQAMSHAGELPQAWRQALRSAHEGPVGRALSRCHRAGIDRGAARRGRVVVRLAVDGTSGRVQRGRVELSTLGDDEEARCIAQALVSHLRLPGRSDVVLGQVEMSVPVRLTADER